MNRVLSVCKSVSGRIIHLSERVWTEKISKAHREFSQRIEYLGEVKKTIEVPDYVVIGWAGEYLALRYCKIAPAGPKYLCVIYRELDDEGFVITAFFISRIHKILRRGSIWTKPKS